MSPTVQFDAAESLGVLTRDCGMLGLVERAARFARSDISVLITGESGTGKEVFARAIHTLSARRNGPFGVVNVAALPESLIESSLFGSERGSFTGSSTNKTGLIEASAGGTFFFDEIGDFPLQLQAKLLRVIQERKVMRVGATAEQPVDTRFVFATHQNLPDLVEQNLFRKDLFYRVSEVELQLPALRDRGCDSVFLARYFARKVGQDVLGSPLELDPHCLAFISRHSWPGNVRELYSAIKRAVILCEGQFIEEKDLQIQDSARPKIEMSGLSSSTSTAPHRASEADTTDTDPGAAEPVWDAETLHRARIEAEANVVLACLKEHQGNISLVAKALHISRPTVYSILRKAKEWVTQ
jgi:two-component system, NtrC family, response regulator